jgi:hypothetical protein
VIRSDQDLPGTEQGRKGKDGEGGTVEKWPKQCMHMWINELNSAFLICFSLKCSKELTFFRLQTIVLLWNIRHSHWFPIHTIISLVCAICVKYEALQNWNHILLRKIVFLFNVSWKYLFSYWSLKEVCFIICLYCPW